MNVERFHAIVNAIHQDLAETQVVSVLEKLTAVMQNQIGNPAEPSFQKQVAEFRQKLIEALTLARSNQFPATWKQTLEELEVVDLFGLALAKQIDGIFSKNQITPTVAREELLQVLTRLKTLADTTSQLRKALRSLKIGAEDLPPGVAELGVLIPREFVSNRLDSFAKELKEDDRIFGVFAELTTGSRPGFPIRSISSSDLSIFLELINSKTAACITLAVSSLIGAYKKILEIRKLRQDLQEQGVPEGNLEGIHKHAGEVMDNEITETVERLVTEFYARPDDGRIHELKIELTYAMRNIAARIDRGFNIEVRIAPSKVETNDSDPENNARFEQIVSEHSPTLQFLKPEGAPILALPRPPQSVKEQDSETGDAVVEPKQKKKK